MIRPATEADRTAILALHLASWQDSYGIELPRAVLRDDLPGHLAEKWAGRVFAPPVRIRVAETAGEIVGFVCALEDRRPPLIDNLHVRPGLRGGGWGGRLLSAILQDLHGAGHDLAELTVLARNDRARAFYLAHGGLDAGREDDHLVGRPVKVHRMRFHLGDG